MAITKIQTKRLFIRKCATKAPIVTLSAGLVDKLVIGESRTVIVSKSKDGSTLFLEPLNLPEGAFVAHVYIATDRTRGPSRINYQALADMIKSTDRIPVVWNSTQDRAEIQL